MATPSLEQVTSYIQRFAPIYKLHPSEHYLPCSIEWFLQQATLVDGGNAVASFDHTPNTLPADTTKKYWLTLPDGARGGDISSAKAYVNVKFSANSAFTFLQFWFFYAFNGPGRAHIKQLVADTGVKSADVTLGTLGQHTGDWEHVTMKVDNATNELVSVYFSQHDSGVWYTDVKPLARSGEQVIVYSSLNGHASYPAAGANYTEHRKYTVLGTGLEFFLRNDTADGGLALDCSKNYEIVSSPFQPDLGWLAFQDRWGPALTEHMTAEDAFMLLVHTLGWVEAALAPEFVGVLTAVLTIFAKEDENGPVTPSAKPYWPDPGSEK